MIRSILVAFTAIIFLLPVHAQEVVLLAPLSKVFSHLEAGETGRWQLPVLTGSVLSFELIARSGDLDPILRLFDETGELVLHSSDITHPLPQQVLIEAFTIPYSAVYTIEVSGGATSGDYELGVLPGYAEWITSNLTDPDAWKSPTPDQLLFSPDRLSLTTSSGQPSAYAQSIRASFGDQFYVHAVIESIDNDERWLVGLTVGTDTEAYHSFSVNHEGLWRFAYHQGEQWEAIKQWRTHPSIVAGEDSFSLGILINNGHFDVYYNGQYLESVMDERSVAPGAPGVLAGDPNALANNSRVHLSRFVVTTPASPQADPTRLRFVPTSTAANLRALRRANLIPNVGDYTLLIPESYWQTVDVGVSLFPIIRESTNEEFVFTTIVSWVTESSADAGCGLVFDFLDSEDYRLAFVDSGGYGLSQRIGSRFENQSFAEHLVDTPEEQHLLILSRAGVAAYYLDGRFAGMMENATDVGSVAFSVLNYADAFTQCRFRDTALWVWD